MSHRSGHGAESGIAVIDVDLPLALPSIDRLLDAGLPSTLTALTGGGGLHLVYATEDSRLRNNAGRLPGIDEELTGVDLRANRGYVAAPPTIHRSGGRYEWLDDSREIAQAPAWLKHRCERRWASISLTPPASKGTEPPAASPSLTTSLSDVWSYEYRTEGLEGLRFVFSGETLLEASGEICGA